MDWTVWGNKDSEKIDRSCLGLIRRPGTWTSLRYRSDERPTEETEKMVGIVTQRIAPHITRFNMGRKGDDDGRREIK